jgi:hypothetical protein
LSARDERQGIDRQDKARKVAAKAETERHFGAVPLHYARMLETTTEEKIRKEARFRM